MIISQGEIAKMPDQEEPLLRGVKGHHCPGDWNSVTRRSREALKPVRTVQRVNAASICVGVTSNSQITAILGLLVILDWLLYL